MKKFLLDTRATLGITSKDDTANAAKDNEVKAVNEALHQYTRSLEKMKAASLQVAVAMEGLSKAVAKMGETKDDSDNLRKITADFSEAMARIHEENAASYGSALDECKFDDLHKKLGECKELNKARDKAKIEYNSNRDGLERKVDMYKKLRKDYTTNKSYDEEVAKRDVLEKELNAAEKKCKASFVELEAEKKSEFFIVMKKLTKSTSEYFSSMDKEVRAFSGGLDNIKN